MANKIKILLASPRGFCAGVDRAIDIVKKTLKKFGSPVYVRHEIVHNKQVVDSLKKIGAIFIEELNEIKDKTRPVIFSAHGVPKSVPKNKLAYSETGKYPIFFEVSKGNECGYARNSQTKDKHSLETYRLCRKPDEYCKISGSSKAYYKKSSPYGKAGGKCVKVPTIIEKKDVEKCRELENEDGFITENIFNIYNIKILLLQKL